MFYDLCKKCVISTTVHRKVVNVTCGPRVRIFLISPFYRTSSTNNRLYIDTVTCIIYTQVTGTKGYVNITQTNKRTRSSCYRTYAIKNEMRYTIIYNTNVTACQLKVWVDKKFKTNIYSKQDINRGMQVLSSFLLLI